MRSVGICFSGVQVRLLRLPRHAPELDTRAYARGISVSDQDMAVLNIARDPFHGEWNYTIQPHMPENSTVTLWQTLTSLRADCGEAIQDGRDHACPAGSPRRSRLAMTTSPSAAGLMGG